MYIFRLRRCVEKTAEIQMFVATPENWDIISEKKKASNLTSPTK